MRVKTWVVVFVAILVTILLVTAATVYTHIQRGPVRGKVQHKLKCWYDDESGRSAMRCK